MQTETFSFIPERPFNAGQLALASRLNQLASAFREKALQDGEWHWYSTRDNCGPAALDFIEFAQKRGIEDITRVRGHFLADRPVFEKLDFSRQEWTDMRARGFSPNLEADRVEYARQHGLLERLRIIPHYWCEYHGILIDVVGQAQFVDTGLADRLRAGQYRREATLDELIHGHRNAAWETIAATGDELRLRRYFDPCDHLPEDADGDPPARDTEYLIELRVVASEDGFVRDVDFDVQAWDLATEHAAPHRYQRRLDAASAIAMLRGRDGDTNRILATLEERPESAPAEAS